MEMGKAWYGYGMGAFGTTTFISYFATALLHLSL